MTFEPVENIVGGGAAGWMSASARAKVLEGQVKRVLLRALIGRRTVLRGSRGCALNQTP